MSGGPKDAKRPLERPLDGSVRPLVEKRPARPCVQQGNANAARRDMHAHERRSVRDPAVRGNPKLHWPGKACMNGAFNGRSCPDHTCGGRRRTDTPDEAPFWLFDREAGGGKMTRSLSIALPTVAVAAAAFRV